MRVTLSIALIVMSLAAIQACGGSGGESSAGASGTLPPPERAASTRAQIARADPCGWVQRADAERILGALAADPVRVHSAERPEPDPEGSGCLLRPHLASGGGTYDLGIEVALDGALEVETGLGAALPGPGDGLTARTRPGQSQGDGRWDWSGGAPGIYAARRGHLLVMIADQAPYLGRERLDSLSAHIVDAIPDLPFAQSESDLASTPSGPDPCTLLTAREATELFGELPVPPDRSRESSPMAHGNGPSCTYFLGHHRVLVITPTWSDAGMAFRMMADITGLVGRVLSNESATETAEGPWEQTTTGVDGTLYFLRGDKMLAIQHGLSDVGVAAALRAARAAVGRL